jgi:hypothetical protein
MRRFLFVVLLFCCSFGVRAEEVKYPVAPEQFRGTWKDQSGDFYEIRYNEPRHFSYIVTKNKACQFLNEIVVKEEEKEVVYNAGCFDVGDIKKIKSLKIAMTLTKENTMSLWMGDGAVLYLTVSGVR